MLPVPATLLPSSADRGKAKNEKSIAKNENLPSPADLAKAENGNLPSSADLAKAKNEKSMAKNENLPSPGLAEEASADPREAKKEAFFASKQKKALEEL